MPDKVRRMTRTEMSRIIVVAAVATDHPQLPRDNKDASVIFRKIIPETRLGVAPPIFVVSRFVVSPSTMSWKIHLSREKGEEESTPLKNARFSICSV